jgi:hypothetical protein
MNREFIPYEQALALKELGFDEPCIKYFWTDGMFAKNYENPFNHNKRNNTISAPLYQQVFRWFREKYNLKSCIMFRTSMEDNKEYYDWLIKGQEVVYRHFNTYEEAELECLKKLIEIVKNK